ncbi:MAG TPA: Uma2 family endonuclease [Candidatus Obscuribacterales bacterium]
MPRPGQRLYITADEYLKKEEASSVRHEYIDGQIFAMTGATLRHSLIVGNIYSILRSFLKGGSCRVVTNDLKVRVEATNCFYYPDVVVSCGKQDFDSVLAERPVLIVEVLSRSTSSIDRREKLLAYRQIESVREYLIVHQRRRFARLFRKNDQGHWESFDYGQGAEMMLTSIPEAAAAHVEVDAIYEGTDVEERGCGSFEVREESFGDEDLDW